jgi:hypothetical protein
MKQNPKIMIKFESIGFNTAKQLQTNLNKEILTSTNNNENK